MQITVLNDAKHSVKQGKSEGKMTWNSTVFCAFFWTEIIWEVQHLVCQSVTNPFKTRVFETRKLFVGNIEI